MNHWPGCIAIWYGTSLWPGDSTFVQMKSLESQMTTP